MSVYATDPQVTDMGGLSLVFDRRKGVSGTVVQDDNGGWRALFDGSAGSPQTAYPTADAAIRSMIGDPQDPPAPGAAMREIEAL